MLQKINNGEMVTIVLSMETITCISDDQFKRTAELALRFLTSLTISETLLNSQDLPTSLQIDRLLS